jgi:hypothetical protein
VAGVGEGQRGEGTDVVDGDELHDRVVVPGHGERAVLEEPVRAGEVFHEPGGAQDRGTFFSYFANKEDILFPDSDTRWPRCG